MQQQDNPSEERSTNIYPPTHVEDTLHGAAVSDVEDNHTEHDALIPRASSVKQHTDTNDNKTHLARLGSTTKSICNAWPLFCFCGIFLAIIVFIGAVTVWRLVRFALSTLKLTCCIFDTLPDFAPAGCVPNIATANNDTFTVFFNPVSHRYSVTSTGQNKLVAYSYQRSFTIFKTYDVTDEKLQSHMFLSKRFAFWTIYDVYNCSSASKPMFTLEYYWESGLQLPKYTLKSYDPPQSVLAYIEKKTILTTEYLITGSDRKSRIATLVKTPLFESWTLKIENAPTSFASSLLFALPQVLADSQSSKN